VHSKNYLHRDIKPENFLIGLGEDSATVYIIDFGLTMLYRNPLNGNHIQYSIGKSLTGTPRYLSISAHLGYEQSRRDDLESILYVIIYLLKGKLLWQNINAETKQDKYKKILEVKRNTHLETLCAELPSISFKNCRGDIKHAPVCKKVKV